MVNPVPVPGLPEFEVLFVLFPFFFFFLLYAIIQGNILILCSMMANPYYQLD